MDWQVRGTSCVASSLTPAGVGGASCSFEKKKKTNGSEGRIHDGAQLAECLPSMYKTLGSVPTTAYMRTGTYASVYVFVRSFPPFV